MSIGFPFWFKMTALALCIWRYPETENLTNAQIHQAINMLHLSLNANATVTCERIGEKKQQEVSRVSI